MQPRIGFGHGTLRRGEWDGMRTSVSREVPARPGLGRWLTDLGDGTVPVLSGLPPEVSHPPTGMKVESTHGRIVNLPEVAQRVQDAEDYPMPRPRARLRLIERDFVPMVLGVTMDDLALTGQPIPVSATVRGDRVGAQVGAGGRCAATVVPGGGSAAGSVSGSGSVSGAGPASASGPPVELDWDSETRSFVGELPPQSAGGFTVRFDFRGDDELCTKAALEVLDPAGVEGSLF